MDYPDTPEAVALELWIRIREAEAKNQPAERGRNVPVRADLLALYAECLSATNGRYSDSPSGFLN
jgi:hypothetical protein